MSGIGRKILKPHSAIPLFLLGRDPEDRSPVAAPFLETILLLAGRREADSLSPSLSKSVDRAFWMGTSTLEPAR
jgi:hypothetical protein